MKILRFPNSKDKFNLKDSYKSIKCFSSQFLENEISSLKKEIERKNSFLEFYNDRTKKFTVKIDSKLNKYLGNSTINNTKNTSSTDWIRPYPNNTPLDLNKNNLKLSSNDCNSNREENLKTLNQSDQNKVSILKSTKINENHPSSNPLSDRSKSSVLFFNNQSSQKNLILNEADQKEINECENIRKRDMIRFSLINSRIRKFSSNVDVGANSELMENEFNLLSSISCVDKKIKTDRKYTDRSKTIKSNDGFLKVDMLYNKIFDPYLADNLGINLEKKQPKISLENQELNHKLYRMKYSTYYLKSVVDYSYSSLMSEKIKILNECLKKNKLEKETKCKSKESSNLEKKEISSKTENFYLNRKNVKSLTITKLPSSCKLINLKKNIKSSRTTLNNDPTIIKFVDQSNSTNKKLAPLSKDFNLISNRSQV